MTTHVEKSIEVDVPIHTAYNQWTQFEQFPQFMGGVQQVQQVSDTMLHWVAEIAGVKREWDARILEQVPDQKVAWAATSGATNAGAVYFSSLGSGRTTVRLSLEYEPEGVVEQVGDFLNIIERRAQADLENFKQFIESRGAETGGWRGSVGEAGIAGRPGVEDAAASRGDSGKAGVSGTAVAAGAAVAAAGAAAAVAATGRSGSGSEERTSAPPAPPLAGSAGAPGAAPSGNASRIDAHIEDGPRAGETFPVDVESGTAPAEILLPDGNGGRNEDGSVRPPTGAVSTYRLVGPHDGGGYAYRVVPHGA